VCAQSNICGQFAFIYNYLNKERITDKIAELKVFVKFIFAASKTFAPFTKAKLQNQSCSD
jgi:hypothetical protein